jgi:hypothetical protein
MADNVHWLRDTYGPALRAFYADLLKQPVPKRFADLVANLEAQPTPEATTSPPIDGTHPADTQQRVPEPDTSD